MSLLISFIALAAADWIGPTAPPPGGNINAPLSSESGDLNLAGSTWYQRNIINVNKIVGYEDLFLKGNSDETGPVYMGGSKLEFYTGGTERMNINNSGWVRLGDGVKGGTINLEVQDDFHRIAFYDLRFWDWNTGGDMVTFNNGTVTIGGESKLTVGTIDPVFEIGGEKYATYVADFAGGVRMETSGIVKLDNGKQIIDFENLEKGNDLWLFWQTSNKEINDVVVLLTPGFEGKVWYEKEGNVLVIYGDGQGEVSYRLSAPRLDFEKWPNFLEDQTLEGIKVPD